MLLVSNEAAGFGFAWTHFERMYAQMAKRVAAAGVRTLVAYPDLKTGVPAVMRGAADAVMLDTRSDSIANVLAVARFARANNVRAVFFIDRPSLHPWYYGVLRLFGVRSIVVYNQTSGPGYRSSLAVRMAKWMLARTRWMTPDVIVGVSDFVTRRERIVHCLPAHKLTRVHNAVTVPDAPMVVLAVRAQLGITDERPIVIVACRAVAEKGVHHLFRAFSLLLRGWDSQRRPPVLVYVGTGPQLAELERLRQDLGAGDSILIAGYRSDVDELCAAADICVVPSVWQDACPYAVLDAMAQGRPVIATRVGGVPEMINSDEVGILVPPGDEPALASAMRELLDDVARREMLGRNARQRIRDAFRPEVQVDRLVAQLKL